MYSIYHFFRNIYTKRTDLRKVKELANFPFDKRMLACRNKGTFPDMAIKLNQDKSTFTGGELVELKDSKTYSVSSFNSTIPAGKKEISKIITSENSAIRKQMTKAGNNIHSLPVRDVYYLVRGKHGKNVKVCLVHGSFFETLSVNDLIKGSFSQVIEEVLKDKGEEISEEIKKKMLTLFSQQENFSKVRDMEKASVKLRFRIMTEVKAEGNILNSNKYPEIKDNTLSFIVALHDSNDEKDHLKKIRTVFDNEKLSFLNIFKIKHYLNGYFLVFQAEIQ